MTMCRVAPATEVIPEVFVGVGEARGRDTGAITDRVELASDWSSRISISPLPRSTPSTTYLTVDSSSIDSFLSSSKLPLC